MKLGIIIGTINRMKREYENELKGFKGDNLTFSRIVGGIQALEELKKQFVGFKKLSD